MVADSVYYNGKIYTVDENSSIYQAVAVKGGRIIALGTDEEILSLCGDNTEKTDLQGKLLMPSFIEAHAHGSSTTSALFTVQLKNCRDKDDYIREVIKYRDEHPGAEYITGEGWQMTLFDEFGPRKEFLDEVANDIPIVLLSEDAHMAWCNSFALNMANITRYTPDPVGGSISKDEAGEPTGVLRDAAKTSIMFQLPGYTVEQYLAGIKNFQRYYNSWGFTAAFDAVSRLEMHNLDAYLALTKSGEATMYYRAGQVLDVREDEKVIDKLCDAASVYCDGVMFGTNVIKLFIDGVVQGRTAILVEPYADSDPENPFYGQHNWDQDKLNKMVAYADRKGMQIHAHTIGDGAVRMMLDAFEYAESQNGSLKEKRHSLTHLELIDEKDIPRFGKLGIIAVINPYWFFRDNFYFTVYQQYMGHERADKQYPVKSLLDTGAMLVSASDHPITMPVNPMEGMQLAITRRAPHTGSCIMCYSGIPSVDDPECYEPLNPSEAVDLETMVRSFTINAARCWFMEDETGSIEVGKSADMVILDRDIFSIDPYTLRDTRVLKTIFRGMTVFEA